MNGIKYVKREYCQCKFKEGERQEVFVDDNDWGWRYACCKCGKEVEGSYTYYNKAFFRRCK